MGGEVEREEMGLKHTSELSYHDACTPGYTPSFPHCVHTTSGGHSLSDTPHPQAAEFPGEKKEP